MLWEPEKFYFAIKTNLLTHDFYNHKEIVQLTVMEISFIKKQSRGNYNSIYWLLFQYVHTFVYIPTLYAENSCIIF